MIKIKTLEVTNFKSLVNTKIELFGNINMFYGFNNSGKSNVFKFLKLLFERKKIGTKVDYNANEDGAVAAAKSNILIQTTNFWNGSILSEPFLFTNNDRSNPIRFKIQLEISNSLLPVNEKLNEFHYLGDSVTVVELIGQIVASDHETSELRVIDAKLNNHRFYKFEDEIDAFFEDNEDEVLTNKIGESILNIFNDLILLIDSDRNFTKEISKNGVDVIDVKNFKNSLFEMNINAEKNETFNKLVQFLSDFDFSAGAKVKLGANLNSFPFNHTTDLGFTKFDDEIEIMLKNASGRFPLKNFGSGIQQFLYILTKIFQNKSRIVIVEELELNLSPLYQVELLKFLITLIPQLCDQLFFSSHSPFFTQQDSNLIDIIHHVRIGFIAVWGTNDELKIPVNTELQGFFVCCCNQFVTILTFFFGYLFVLITQTLFVSKNF